MSERYLLIGGPLHGQEHDIEHDVRGAPLLYKFAGCIYRHERLFHGTGFTVAYIYEYCE